MRPAAGIYRAVARRLPVLAAGACAVQLLMMAGCTVGDGNGVARGPIFFLGCTADSDFGTMEMPRIFDLEPRFFAGEPVEDIAVALPANRLLIRVQRNGNRIEVNDTLYIDVQNAYEVARCVRGRIKPDGTPDYLTTTTTLPNGVPTTTPWCDWSVQPLSVDGGDADAGGAPADAGDGDAGDAAATGVDAGAGARAAHARIHLSTEEIVRSSLSLLFTCHKANVVGMARGGWIDFQDFGGAAEPTLAPEMRHEIDRKFKINYGDRLRATFNISLGDQRVVQAIKDLKPMPMPLIGGQMDGSFDFDLERGRAAQPFP